MNESYERIDSLVTQGRDNEALVLAMDLLDQDHDDVMAMFKVGVLLLKEDRKGLAYNVFARACKLAPDKPELWLNYARAHPDKPEEWGKIEWCLKKSLKLFSKLSSPAPTAWANLAMLYYIKGDLEDAQLAVDKGFADDSLNNNALVTQGFIHLANGAWDKAWALYDVMLKTGKREHCSYGDEPEWEGEKNQRVIVSGEQGLGDEIMYASCFNELIRDSEKVVIECMPRLKDLFQRSFPQAKVYGTRWNKEVFWEEDHNPDAHIAMASMPRFYRHKDSDFPGSKYLIPDSDMVGAVRGMLDFYSPGKPRIGIAWTGGSPRTRNYLRTRTLEELLPLLRQDATWVSLEYQDRSEEIAEFKDKRGIEVLSFPWLTGKGLNYDLTAALVSELDLVISVPTTVTQMSGALGVECWVMVPKYTGWIFARDTYPWAKSVRPFRNTPMKEIAGRLEEWLQDLQVDTKLKAVN